MLRLRASDGEVLPLPADVPFIEITDLDGALARVIYQDEAGVIHVVGPSDPQAVQYARKYNTKWCEVVRLNRTLFPGAEGFVDRTTRK